MSARPDISVILATYNGADQLECCTRSLMATGDTNVEVLIADDGSSNQRTFEIIEGFKKAAPFPVLHAWQEDIGFRLARSRNNAVKHASGEFLLFLDHDLLLPRTFFKTLRGTIRTGWFVGGRRVKLDTERSKRLLEGSMEPRSLFSWKFALQARQERLGGWRYLFPLRDRTPGTTPQPFRGMSGFCIGAWRKDFDAIDGFDDRYRGYGVEDWDFMARLNNAGVHAGYLPRAATVMHLWHKETPHDLEGPGYQMLAEIENKGVTRAQIGYSSLNEEPATPAPQEATP